MRAAFAARDAVVELRQYTLHPGRRDELITLFEREFVAPQDAAGARVLGCFRDVDDPDRFVWLRGFDSMIERHAALTRFYDSAVWRAHRDAAVATMRDSDNVLLLRPIASTDGVDAARDAGAWLALIHDVRHVQSEPFAAHVATAGTAMLREHGARAVAVFATESSPNTFARLPVRTDEAVVVSFAGFADLDALDACVAAIQRTNRLRTTAPDEFLPAFMRRPEVLRLLPTDRPAA